MGILDERLPDGRSVYEAVAGLRKPRVSFGAGGLTGIEPVGRTPNAPVSTTPQINPNISMRPEQLPAILGPRVSPVIPSNAGLEPPSAGVSIPNPRIDPNKIDFNPYPQDASKSGRLAIDLGAMQGASPRSPIQTTDEGVSVGAPKPKGHGLLNTLKYLGKGAVINMGRIASERAAHGQNASLGELLGAGGAGAAVGGISPISIDQDIANAAIQRKQGELGNQLEIEKQQALIDKAQQGPAPSQARHKIVVPDDSLKAEGINAGDEVWADVNGQPLIANGRHVLAARKKEPTVKPPMFRTVQNADGSTKTMKSVDSGATWTEEPVLRGQRPAPAITPYQQTEINRQQSEDARKQNEAASESQSDYEQAQALDRELRGDPTPKNVSVAGVNPGIAGAVASQLGDKGLYGQRAELDSILKRGYRDEQGDVDIAFIRQERNALNTQIREKENQRNALFKSSGRKKATAGSYTTPTPTTHGFSIQGWLARNPGKTEADARAFHDNDPKYKSYPIVP